MKIETVPLASLHPPETNVRSHPEQQITELVRAIRKFGQTRPVVIDETGTVLAGNGLVMALQKMAASQVNVLRMKGLSADDKAKLILSDNKIYALGHDDYDGVMTLIRGLGDFDIPGFDGDLLTSLMTSDISSTQSLDAFGQMTDDEITQRTSNTQDPPTVQTQHSEGQVSVVCPHCGKDFTIQ